MKFEEFWAITFFIIRYSGCFKFFITTHSVRTTVTTCSCVLALRFYYGEFPKMKLLFLRKYSSVYFIIMNYNSLCQFCPNKLQQFILPLAIRESFHYCCSGKCRECFGSWCFSLRDGRALKVQVHTFGHACPTFK